MVDIERQKCLNIDNLNRNIFKPNVERLFRNVYEMMREVDEKNFPEM